MTGKEYLNGLRKLKRKRDNKVRQCQDIRDKILFLQGIDYGKDKVQTSAHDQLSATMAVLLDLESEAMDLIDRYSRLYNEAINRINSLSRKEYIDILLMRYLEEDPKERKFEHIACVINYSYVRTCHLHGEALRELEDRYLT